MKNFETLAMKVLLNVETVEKTLMDEIKPVHIHKIEFSNRKKYVFLDFFSEVSITELSDAMKEVASFSV